MNKLNKLFAILIAVLGVNTLSAQQTPSAGNIYYMYNPETGLFLSRGARYGCAAWADNFGIPVTLIANGDGYWLQYLDNSSHYVSDAWWSWADGGTNRAQTYTLDLVSEGNYKLINTAHNDNRTLYINEGGDGGFSHQIASNGKYGDNCKENWDIWQFLTSEERETIVANKKAASELACAQQIGYALSSGETLQSLVNDVNNFTTSDRTNAINNAALVGNYNGWKWTGTSGGPANTNYGIEVYQGSGQFTQTVSGLTPGLYKATLSAFFRDGSNENCSAKSDEGWRLSNAYFEANGNQTMIADWASNRSANNAPNGPEAAKRLFDEGKYKNEVFAIVGDDGVLNLTIAQPGGAVGGRWFFFANVTLTYYNDKVEANAVTEILENYNALLGRIPAVVEDNLKSAKESFSKNQTISNYNALNVIISEANKFVAPYDALSELMSLCETYASERFSNVEAEDIRTTFTTTIANAKNNARNAESISELNATYETLETARQEFTKVAIPTVENSFDMTFLIKNAQVESNDGWETNVGINNNVDYEGAPDIYAFDKWHWGPMAVYANQTIDNLPDGVYTLTAMARTNGADMCYVFAKSNDVEYKEVVIGGGNTGNPWGLVRVSGIVVNKDASMTLGLQGEINNTWFSVDNFKLYRGYDATVAQNAVEKLVSEAESLKDEVMNKDVKKALEDAISSADKTNDNPFELGDMTSALSSAVTNAKASIADYDKLKMYIDMTAVFADVATYQAKYDSRAYTSDDVEPVRKELNVVRYNAASVLFANKVDVTGWTGTMGGMDASGQHWDGTSTKYYDKNSWSGTAHSTTANIELPKGTYVLKAALRSHAETTLKLTVLDNVVDVDGKGDEGYGIDVNGNATFAEEATYANEDKGRGWEWEFVKFTLTETTTVELKVECNYNGVYGWASFSDITLWMDDATYVTVYGKQLEVPLETAKALVNTKPMGAEENAALVAAINQAEGTISTPAELNAAVDALNTAVVNANAWLIDYNEAKAPLVAALERFEADYNNAENGSLYHMNKDCWATVVEKAQAAAVAKDATDSYDGFAEATKNLNDALDAATVSIGEYAALKEALDAATELNNAPIWGDAPFQRPVSAKVNTTAANNVYTNADADGEGVTSVTVALNNAMNNITLNAPSEDDLFYITVATEGHPLLDNYVVASLGTTSANNPTGYSFNASADNTYNPLTKAYTFEQVEGNNYRISVKVNAETVYLTYGELNGSEASWKKQQIQGTTDINKAGEFRIEASTTKEGVVKIFNTIDNNYLDCQNYNDEKLGSIYTDTGISCEEFALTLVDELRASVAIKISEEIRFSTCVLMFDAELPEGLKAYTATGVVNNCLVLTEAPSLNAYTPYILYAENGYTGTLSGEIDAANYQSVVPGVLSGAIDATIITEGYALSNKEAGVGFYAVNSGAGQQILIPAGKCWLSAVMGQTPGVTARSIGFSFRGGDADGINKVETEPAVLEGAIYTLDGKRVSQMERGQIYIINGNKVMVK